MIRDITIGQYYPADSVLHKMDPRAKLVGTLVFIISVSVSYTHLDVYKRQLKGRKATSYPSFMEVLSKDGAVTSEDSVVVDGNITTSRGPVSYTHLDVYKKQGSDYR